MRCPYCNDYCFRLRLVFETDEGLCTYEAECTDCGRHWHVTIPNNCIRQTKPSSTKGN